MLLWNPVPVPVFDPSTGEKAGGALAYFYVGGTTTPLDVFPTDEGAAKHPWPVVADANGVFPPVFIPYGPFGYRVTTSGGAAISPNLSTVQNPAPASSGGGGSVPDDQLVKTGRVFWEFGNVQLSGSVRLNAKTIGSVASGASERANADTEALYTLLYNRLSDSVCPVLGGRGTNAAADFAAGKQLTVPDLRGRTIFGLDDMGNAAADRFGSLTFLNGNATTPGSTLGAALHILTIAQIPAITPAGSITFGTATVPAPTNNNFTGSTAVPQATGFWNGSGVSTNNVSGLSATFAGTAFGSGQAHPNMPPSMLGTWYVKL